MTTLEFPSALFPGRPTLELAVPAGWQPIPAVREVDGVALAVLRPLPADEFRANVVVTVDEVAADHSVRTDLDAVAVSAAERTEGAVAAPYGRSIGGVLFAGRDLSHVDPVAGTLLVSTLFGFLRRDVDGRLVRLGVTGTVGGSHAREDYAELHTVIDSLQISPAEGTTAVVEPLAGDPGADEQAKEQRS